MGLVQERSAGWKWLKTQMEAVQDHTLKTAMMAEFRKRALSEWGYDPETGKTSKTEDIIFDDWEKEFLTDIKNAEMFELDTREKKREAELKELKKNMYFFIKEGGTLSDIPAEIRTDFIVDIYLEVLKKCLIG